MKNHCTFSKNHSCPLWTDYELTCYELEEANSLCHGNWIEIERQYKYIQTLQKSYQIMISHIPTNMILTNYLRGPGIIPDPQTRPSSLSLKPAPQTKPSKTLIIRHFLARVHYSNSQIKSRHYTLLYRNYGFICVPLSKVPRLY